MKKVNSIIIYMIKDYHHIIYHTYKWYHIIFNIPRYRLNICIQWKKIHCQILLEMVRTGTPCWRTTPNKISTHSRCLRTFLPPVYPTRPKMKKARSWVRCSNSTNSNSTSCYSNSRFSKRNRPAFSNSNKSVCCNNNNRSSKGRSCNSSKLLK